MHSMFGMVGVVAIAGISAPCNQSSVELGGHRAWEQDVRIPVKRGGVSHLAASLHTATREPGPAVLLVPGAGATDRNWNNPNIPGLNGSGASIASALARAGFTVLAYDRRGAGRTPAGRSPGPMAADQDALAALEFLLERGHPVGLLGHGEGTAVYGPSRIKIQVMAGQPAGAAHTGYKEEFFLGNFILLDYPIHGGEGVIQHLPVAAAGA